MKNGVPSHWQWFWSSNPVFAVPLWENAGRPRNYGSAKNILPEFSEGTPEWVGSPFGIGVQYNAEPISWGVAEDLVSTVPQGSLQAVFIAGQIPPDDQVVYTGNNFGNAIEIGHGSAGTDDAGFNIRYNPATGQWRFDLSDPNDNGLRFTHKLDAGSYFSAAYFNDYGNAGYAMLNGLVRNSDSPHISGDAGAISMTLSARSFWEDWLWLAPMYCGYYWNTAFGSTLPSAEQMAQLHKDPWGPFRHYRDTSPGPYQYFDPQVSRQIVHRVPAKPQSWNWDNSLVSEQWRDLNPGMFYPMWEGSGITVHDVVSGDNSEFDPGNEPTWDHDQIGYYLELDGDQWVNVSTTSPLPTLLGTPNGPYWHIAYFRADDAVTEQDVVGSSGNRRHGITMNRDVAGSIRVNGWGALSAASSGGFFESGDELIVMGQLSLTTTNINARFINLTRGTTEDMIVTGATGTDGDEFIIGARTNSPANALDGAIYWYMAGAGVRSLEWATEIAEDPTALMRHYRDTSPGSYQYFNPQVSIQEHKYVPSARPPEWNVSSANVAPAYQNLNTVFAWEGYPTGTEENVPDANIGRDRISGLWANNAGSSQDQARYVPSEVGFVIEYPQSTTQTAFSWDGILGVEAWLEEDLLVESLIWFNPPLNDSSPHYFIRVGAPAGKAEASVGIIYANDQWVINANRDLVGVNPSFTGTNAFPQHQWVHVAARFHGANSWNGNSVDIFVDGILVIGTANNGSGTGGDPQDQLQLALAAGNANFEGKQAMARVHRGWYGDETIRRLAYDPWGPIRYYRDTSPGPYQYFNPEVSLQQGGDPLKPKSWSIM